jgi:PAS domain S-box-containing protein
MPESQYDYAQMDSAGPTPTPPLVFQALLGEALDYAEIGVSVYDDDGRLIAVNEQAAAVLGENRDELLKRDVADFTDGGIDRRVLFERELREGVRLIHRKDGSAVPVAFVVAPTRVAKLAYFVAFYWLLAPDDPRAQNAT